MSPPNPSLSPVTSFRLERWHRRSVYACGAALLVTGLTWLLARYALRGSGPYGETISPLEPWSMRLHGSAAMVMLFFLGSLLNGHIRRALRAGRNRLSGWTLIAVFGALSLTGLALYYFTSDNTRPLWSLVHWTVGLAAGALLPVHIWLGWRAVGRI